MARRGLFLSPSRELCSKWAKGVSETGSVNWNIPDLPGGVGCLSFLPKEDDDSCSPAFCSRHCNHKNEIIWKGRELKSAALSWMLLFSWKMHTLFPGSPGEAVGLGLLGMGMGWGWGSAAPGKEGNTGASSCWECSSFPSGTGKKGRAAGEWLCRTMCDPMVPTDPLGVFGFE